MTHNEEIAFIVVVGLTGSGKTTFVNHASGSNFEVGHGMSSCTKAVAATNTFAGPSDQRVVLIDTPGFDSSDTNKSDKQALRDIAINVGRIYGAEKKKRLAGVIYMHRISDPRLGRSTTDNVQRALRLVAKMSKRRVVIATTFGIKLTHTTPMNEKGTLRREIALVGR